jgi:hypothetical protein
MRTTTITAAEPLRLPVLGCPVCLRGIGQTGDGSQARPYRAVAHNGPDGSLCEGTGDDWTVTDVIGLGICGWIILTAFLGSRWKSATAAWLFAIFSALSGLILLMAMRGGL